MILVIDNYDSFVHNLARYFRQLGCQTVVVRNDKIDVAEAQRLKPQAIVISPGPCTPNEAGCSLELIRQLGATIPMLGICLGHQAIVQALGGSIVLANEPVHGRQSTLRHSSSAMFDKIPDRFVAGRYHSLVANPNQLPSELVVTARSEDGTIMAVEHRTWPLVGLQFHPESILTNCGYQLLTNFLQIAAIETADTGATNATMRSPWGEAKEKIEPSVRSARLSMRDASGIETGTSIP